MTDSNRPAFRAVVADERGEGTQVKTFWTPIGAAWPTRSGKGFNIRLDMIPVGWDGRFTLVEADEMKSADPQPAKAA